MPTGIVEMAALHDCLADYRLPLVSQSGDMMSVLPSPIQDYVSEGVISHLEIQSDRMVDRIPNAPVRLPHMVFISASRLISLSCYISYFVVLKIYVCGSWYKHYFKHFSQTHALDCGIHS